MIKNILITGGAGFVGSNLAIKLKRKYPSCNIVSFDNLKRRGSELNIPRLKREGVVFIHGDIRNKEDFKNIKKFDLMIECSAEPSVLAGVNSSITYLLNTNLFGTLNCLEEVKKNKASLIFLSTSRVYPINLINNLDFVEEETRFVIKKEQKIKGISVNGIDEEFPIDCYRSLYGATKYCSEIFIQEYIHSFGIKGIINRCSIITGPWQMGKIDQGVFVLWVASHIFNKKLKYIGYGGKGKQVRDFLHIDDLFRLIDIQINSIDKLNGEISNVGGGIENSISLLELTKICEEITGKKTKIGSQKETKPNDLKFYITDYSKINRLTGWYPVKGVNATISDIADWINKNKEVLINILF